MGCGFTVTYQHTVDGSEILRSPVEVGSLSHYLQGVMCSLNTPKGATPSLFGVLVVPQTYKVGRNLLQGSGAPSQVGWPWDF